MKKIFLLSGVCALSMLICIHTNAQDNRAPEYARIRITSLNNTGSRQYINNINIKAVRYLKERYKDVSNEIWSKSNQGEYLVYFTLNGIITRLYFNRKGIWHATLKTYTEDKLPFIIRDKVKSKYYDYSIGSINELVTADSNGLPTYIIDIKYKDNIKILRIYDGEMEVWKQFEQP